MDLEVPQTENEKYFNVFIDFKKGKDKKVIAQEYGVSTRTIERWIAVARSTISADLIGSKAKDFRGDIFYQYQHVYELAEQSFNSTGNPNFLKEMRQVTGQMATLLGLNAPPKAAVQGDDEELADDNISFVLDESQYKAAEEEYNKAKAKIIEYEGDVNTIEGEIKS